MVCTRTHTHTPIRDIKIGDAVWDGTEFTDVFMLSRADEQAEAIFVTIDELRLTPSHLVVRGKFTASGQLQDELIPAGKIRVGDKIRDSNRTWKAVASVMPPTFGDGGTFEPLTMSGKIAVDGIVCSCYTVTNPPEIFIPLTAPVRMLYRASPAAVKSICPAVWNEKTSRFALFGRSQPSAIARPDFLDTMPQDKAAALVDLVVDAIEYEQLDAVRDSYRSKFDVTDENINGLALWILKAQMSPPEVQSADMTCALQCSYRSPPAAEPTRAVERVAA